MHFTLLLLFVLILSGCKAMFGPEGFGSNVANQNARTVVLNAQAELMQVELQQRQRQQRAVDKRKAAEQGDPDAQAKMGNMYGKGEGVSEDFVKNAEMTAQHSMVKQDLADGEPNLAGTSQDAKDLREYLKKQYDMGSWGGKEEDLCHRLAAEEGDAAAQYLFGDKYYGGLNYKEALRWYQLAAGQGHPNAQEALGLMYFEGQGIPQDYRNALHWVQLAAKQGGAQAQYNLGIMYSRGEGVPKDYAHQEALKWWLMAAAQGYPTAQYNLGVGYENGDGVPQDFVQAHMWYNLAAVYRNLAAVYSNVDYRKQRDLLANRMTPAQIAEAQRLAGEWKPTIQKNSEGWFFNLTLCFQASPPDLSPQSVNPATRSIFQSPKLVSTP